jgi:flagellar motility protein MotE (MotC chaperone)
MHLDHEDETESHPTTRRLRLLPLTMVMLSLLLVIKVNELYIGSQSLRELYTARDAEASGAEAAKKEDAPKSEPAKEAAAQDAAKKDAAAPADAKKDDAAKANPEKKEPTKEGAAPADVKKEESAHGEAKKDEAAPADAKKEEGGHEEGKKEEGEHGAAEKPPEEPKTFGTGKSTVKEIEALKMQGDASTRFSKNEIDLLENLSKRRDELDKREKELEIKTKVLEATQKRIDDRIQEMKTLDAQLSKLVTAYDEKQNAQIASLVKIYENMKPNQAAGIFNELDMPILLEVIDKMSERKVAPVLAQMDPKKARDVTQELAAMRSSSPKVAAPAAKP